MIAYHNGNYIEFDEISISPKDLGFSRAYCAYEALTCVGTRIFKLSEHFERLQKTLSYTRIQSTVTLSEVEEIISNLIRLNNLEKSRTAVKLYITGGYSANGFSYQPGNETIIIYIEPAHSHNPQNYTNGVHLVSVTKPNISAAYKTNNYLDTVHFQHLLAQNSAYELLWVTHDGYILECSTSCIACVRNGVVCFPQYGDSILSSITALSVKQLLEKLDIPYVEEPITLIDFLDSDEVFSMSSFKDILPVTSIDSQKIGTGLVGTLTKKLMNAYSEMLFQQ